MKYCQRSFCCHLGSFPRTPVGTITSKWLYTYALDLFWGWLYRFCLEVSLFNKKLNFWHEGQSQSSETEIGNYETSQELGPRVAQAYFCCILLEKAIHTTYPDSRRRKDFTTWWEVCHVHTEWEGLSGDFLPCYIISAHSFWSSSLTIDIFFSLFSSLI